MKYSDVDQVLTVAGLHSNTLITDALVDSKIIQADAIIDGVISDCYQLPLNMFWQNIITFSGTGSGTATMTITINGVDFTVAVTSGQTATEAAELLRTAIITSTSGDTKFEDGPHESDAVVRIISTPAGKDANTYVTLTSTDPQTVSGITATGGAVTSIAHPLISTISAEIAAAYLLQIAYGKESENTDKDGYARMESALGMLEKIQNKQIKLFDGEGDEFTTATLARMAFYPNDTSSDGDGDEADTTNRFSINREY